MAFRALPLPGLYGIENRPGAFNTSFCLPDQTLDRL
jgi:hypothetical protein